MEVNTHKKMLYFQCIIIRVGCIIFNNDTFSDKVIPAGHVYGFTDSQLKGSNDI